MPAVTGRPQESPGASSPGAGTRTVTVSDLIRPARGAMILSGALTAVGAVLSIVPFVALRNLAAIWLEESDAQGLAARPWTWAVVAVGSLFVAQLLYLTGLGVTHLAEARLRHLLRTQVVDALCRLPLGRVAAIPHGTIRKMVCDDTTAIHTLVAHMPGDTTNAVVMALAGTAYLLWTDWALTLALLGVWLLALAAAESLAGYPPLAGALVLIGAGIGVAAAVATGAVLGSVPAGRAGAASAISETGFELGAALGIAVLGSVQDVGYRMHLGPLAGDAVSALPGSVVAAARQSLATLAGAVDRADAAQAGFYLQAQRAFTHAMQTTAVVAAVILPLAAVMAWRHVPAGDASDQAGER